MNLSLPYDDVSLDIHGRLQPVKRILKLTPYMVSVLKYENPSWNFSGWPPSLVNKQTGAAGPAQVKPGILLDLNILQLHPEAVAAVRQYEKTRKYTTHYRQVLAATLPMRKSNATAAQYLMRSEAAYAERLRKMKLPVTIANMVNLHAYGMYSKPKADSQATRVANAVVQVLNDGRVRAIVDDVTKYAALTDEVLKAVSAPYKTIRAIK